MMVEARNGQAVGPPLAGDSLSGSVLPRATARSCAILLDLLAENGSLRIEGRARWYAQPGLGFNCFSGLANGFCRRFIELA